jgi:hypothetical protein
MAHLERIEREVVTIRALARDALRRGHVQCFPSTWLDFAPARVLRDLRIEDASRALAGRSCDDGPEFLAAHRGAVVLARWCDSARHVEFFSSRLSTFAIVDGRFLESLGR